MTEIMFLKSLLEITMLICFGAAWPISIYKSWTSRSSRGKSLLFLVVIIVGYLAALERGRALRRERDDGLDRHAALFPQRSAGKKGRGSPLGRRGERRDPRRKRSAGIAPPLHDYI